MIIITRRGVYGFNEGNSSESIEIDLQNIRGSYIVLKNSDHRGRGIILESYGNFNDPLDVMLREIRAFGEAIMAGEKFFVFPTDQAKEIYKQEKEQIENVQQNNSHGSDM